MSCKKFHHPYTSHCPGRRLTGGKRPAEMEGVHYYFISEQEFSKMVKNNEFVEYAQVFDNFYGTSFAEINARLADGIDVVLACKNNHRFLNI